ncbi:glycosyltransferase family 9 protein [Pseudomonadota bacterium]
MPVILIFRIGQLGDTLISLPAIDAIRLKYPDHRLVLLTDRHQTSKGYVSSWDILEPTGWFDQVIYYDARVQGSAKLTKMLALAKVLRSLEIDHLYNLSPVRTKSATLRDELFFRYMTGAKNYHARPSFKAPASSNKGLPKLMPEWQALCRIVNTVSQDNHDFHLPIPQSEKEAVISFVQSQDIDLDKKIIVIGPGSKMPAKQWPQEYFELLGKKLLHEYPQLQLIILGGKEDSSVGEYLSDAWGRRSYNLAGKLSIYGSATLLAKSILYVGNDTGTMHLAAMAGAPCLALFSARDYPGKWWPYGEQHRVLRRKVECEGCMSHVCEYGNKCLKEIKPEDVFEVAKNMIQAI